MDDFEGLEAVSSEEIGGFGLIERPLNFGMNLVGYHSIRVSCFIFLVASQDSSPCRAPTNFWRIRDVVVQGSKALDEHLLAPRSGMLLAL